MSSADRFLRRVTYLIIVAILVGSIGFVATILNGRAASSASKDDVKRTTDLTQRVAELQELASKVSNGRSDASETRQLTICLRLAQLLKAQNLPVPGSCPANPTVPTLTLSPSPSASPR